jgi:hypothetical protein
VRKKIVKSYYAIPREVETPKPVCMKKIPVMLGILAAVGSLFSCRKESEKVTPTSAVAANATAPAQLAAGAWHQTGLLVSTTGTDKQVVSADLSAHVNPRMLDQLATFETNGTYTVVKGGVAPEPKTGQWKLSATSDSLTLTLPTQVRRLAVTELTTSSLRLSFTDVAANGVVSTYTSVYTR